MCVITNEDDIMISGLLITTVDPCRHIRRRRSKGIRSCGKKL